MVFLVCVLGRTTMAIAVLYFLPELRDWHDGERSMQVAQFGSFALFIQMVSIQRSNRLTPLSPFLVWLGIFPSMEHSIELSKEQHKALETAKRISNPGCYPTGFIALTRPLVDAGILPTGTPVTVNAISGYSGGGKALMNIYENEEHEPWGTYGLSLSHKHVPEMSKYSKLNYKPIFQPAVADFAQGMVVSVPLHYSWLAEGASGAKIHKALTEHYNDCSFVTVMPLGEGGAKEADLLTRGAFLEPTALKNTNQLQLFVFANDKDGQVILAARLDNLGKGASGAAVQNLNIALGLDETAGL
jgi:N-acetyl-gamma-glutamyl-phosphate reductase